MDNFGAVLLSIEDDIKEKENNWCPQWTKLLVQERLSLEKEFCEGKKKKSSLWGTVYRKIKAVDPEFSLSVNDLKPKFYNLWTTYKRVKKRNNSSGRGRTNWVYYDMFEEVYSGKHSIEPPQENLYSTFTIQDPADENDTQVQEQSQRSCQKQSSSSKRFKKDDELLNFLKEQNEEEDRRHKEFIEIEKQKIEIELQKLRAIGEMQSVLKEALSAQANSKN